MDNPFELSPPDDPLARVHEFARDMAYGALIGEWDAMITLNNGVEPAEPHFEDGHTTYENWRDNLRKFYGKWEIPEFRRVKTFTLLIALGYLKQEHVTESARFTRIHYSITDKAFSLLEKPIAPLKIFVSYRRKQSSALSLLVEARLKLADPELDVFVDKDIPVGSDWENELQEKVARCNYFISLIGQHTLVSPNVMDEIEWALDAKCRIVAILHPDFRFEQIATPSARQQNIIDELNKRQLIMIVSESAEHYDSALRKLLNTLGYSTL